MRTVHANFAQVKATRDIFMLLLGTSHPAAQGQEEIRVKLTEQVLLIPTEAKRLSILLNEAIQAYELEFGSLEQKVFRHDILVPTPKLSPPVFKSPEGAEKIKLCFKLLDDLNVKPAYERSFQLQKNKLHKNRFLLGFDPNSIPSEKNEKILNICEKIGMPSELMAEYSKYLPTARIVGFGFGESETACMVRAYLEFSVRFYKAIKEKAIKRDPYLSHLGFKWDASDNKINVITKYNCHPGYTTDDMLKILSKSLYLSGTENLYSVVEKILNLAADKVGNDRFLFLSVDEKDNLRNSFDINLYSAKLQLNEIYTFLIQACRFYSISEKEFHDFYEPVKNQMLGHIAGGTDREGRDFLTIYFGE